MGWDDAWNSVTKAVTDTGNAVSKGYKDIVTDVTTKYPGEGIKAVGGAIGNNTLGNALTHAGGELSNNIWNTWGPTADPAGQTPATPTTPPPTLQDANTVAITQELSDEKSAARASTILTGGQGLLDSPKTASQILLGS